eukprot:2328349-Pleurochrysis_carterae.AAC.7
MLPKLAFPHHTSSNARSPRPAARCPSNCRFSRPQLSSQPPLPPSTPCHELSMPVSGKNRMDKQCGRMATQKSHHGVPCLLEEVKQVQRRLRVLERKFRKVRLDKSAPRRIKAPESVDQKNPFPAPSNTLNANRHQADLKF